MKSQLADELDRLVEDAWRQECGFTEEMAAANRALAAARSDEDAAQILAKWLQRYQPCLFGRIAARAGRLEFCVISEGEISRGDEFVRDKIQEARLRWLRRGHRGEASGFVVLLRSERVAMATPDQHVLELARRLCSLYLLESIETDDVYLDEIFLEQPGDKRATWKWLAGVNYFCAQADGRWWRDHRIPGGLGFSVNSVGHMVKSGQLSRAMQDLELAMGTAHDQAANPVVDTLPKALEFAMRTIALASDGVSGPATWLLERRDPVSRACPIDLPPNLEGKDHCQYSGNYHTDITLPSEYFRADVEKPADLAPHKLDFTYLFDEDLENPDFNLMGTGRRVRTDAMAGRAGTQDPRMDPRLAKRLVGKETVVTVDEAPLLQRALAN